MARAAALGRTLENALLITLLTALILLASAQIVLRNVFSMGLSWGDGLTRLLVLWLALVGALAAARDGRHITMGALLRWLPGRAGVAASALADAFAAAVSAAFAYVSYAFVRDSIEFGDVLLGLPAWWFQAIMPAAFGLIAYRYLVRALKRLREF